MSDGGHADVTINGALIASHSFGSLPQGGSPTREHLTGSYTATATGPHTLNIDNYRNAAQTDCRNYFDNIKLQPVDADFFAASPPNISRSQGGSIDMLVDAGPPNAGEDYLILASGGCHPGFSVDGVHINLNWDNYSILSMTHANGATFQNTLGVLDAAGQSIATINVAGGSGLTVGKSFAFSYVLTNDPMVRPVIYASDPVWLTIIP